MSGHSPDLLDRLEASLRDVTAGRQEAQEFLRALEAAKLPASAPLLDPAQGRSSTLELESLFAALSRIPTNRPLDLSFNDAAPCRAGYALASQGGQEAAVFPAFAAALARGESANSLLTMFPDLWAVDLEVWEALERNDLPLAGERWLTSPGRRLIADLDLLRDLPSGDTNYGAELSLDRIYRAAGVANLPPDPGMYASWLTGRPTAWRTLHTTIPGELMRHWQPSGRAPQDTGRTPALVLGLLERPEAEAPAFTIAPALAWLLDRTVDQPIYEVDGLRRDLREDLPVCLATFFSQPASDALGRPSLAIASALEQVLLAHASHLTAQAHEPGAPLRRWGVARWLHGLLLRSPFFGGDAETLTVRLRALLPAESAPNLPAQSPPSSGSSIPIPASTPDALDASRFVHGGLDVLKVAQVAGALRHYRRQGTLLLPTPLPLVEALRRLADRRLRSEERAAEEALHRGRSEFGWPGHHLAPSLVARQLLTELHVEWLGRMPEAVQAECIALLNDQPADHAWLCQAVATEGEALPPPLRNEATAVWQRLVRSNGVRRIESHLLAHMASGLAGTLSDDELDEARALAAGSEWKWRPFVLDALARSAERHGRHGPWERLIRALFALIDDEKAPNETRLNAALFALRDVSSSNAPEREALLGELATHLARPPMSSHVGLRRELRRLGLGELTTSAADRERHRS